MDIPKSEFSDKAIEIRQRIPYRFGLDLLVRSPEEISSRISYNDWFLREITEKGEYLHISERYHDFEGLQTTSRAVKEEMGSMNPLTLEWIEKAEGDYKSAKWDSKPRIPSMTISVSTRNSVSKNISRHGCRRQMSLSQEHTILKNS